MFIFEFSFNRPNFFVKSIIGPSRLFSHSPRIFFFFCVNSFFSLNVYFFFNVFRLYSASCYGTLYIFVHIASTSTTKSITQLCCCCVLLLLRVTFANLQIFFFLSVSVRCFQCSFVHKSATLIAASAALCVWPCTHSKRTRSQPTKKKIGEIFLQMWKRHRLQAGRLYRK